MKRLSIEAEQIMKERFGKDSVIALATEETGQHIRRQQLKYVPCTMREQ